MLVKNREQYVKAVDQMANPTGWTILRSTSCSETLTQVDGFDWKLSTKRMENSTAKS